VRFTRGAGERIGRAVIGFERQTKAAAPLTFEHIVPGAPASKVFRMASFGTAAWPVDSSAVVTFRGVTNTATVLNEFGSLSTAVSSRQVAIARDGTAWFLLQARCP
jgi:hypothetical protein